MTKQQFTEDLQRIYDELQKRQNALNGFYKLLDGGHDEASKLVDDFLVYLDLKKDDETVMAALTRIINLREDALEQVL